MAGKTELYGRWVNGALVVSDEGQSTGSRFWVCSATGTDGAGYGGSPDRPFATLDYAIGKCTDNKHDIIYVMPGHTETLTTLITCDVIGVKVIGLGQGLDRPEFTVNGTIDGISITADGVTLENLYFNEATLVATANINIAAANATLRHIHMDQGANPVVGITVTAAGERPTIEDCSVIVTANGAGSWCKLEGVVDLATFRRNVIIGCDGTNPYDTGCIDANSTASTNLIIIGNVFDGADQATTAIAGVGSIVGGCYSGNYYAGSAVNADNVATVTATIADGAITTAKFGDYAISALDINTAAITSAKIGDYALAAINFGTDAITAAKIADYAIVALNLDTGAITSAKFAAGAINAAAIADDAIDAATFQDYALVALAIDTGAITSAKFAANAIAAAAIADYAIDALAIATDAIANAKIADGAISVAKFAANAIDATIIADGAIDASAIAANAIDADAIADYAITAIEIDTDAITPAKFAAGAIDASAIADDAIDLGAFADYAIGAVTIATGAVTSAKVADSAVTALAQGIQFTKAAAVVPSTGTMAIATVTGHILLRDLFGEWTVAQSNAACNAKLTHVATTGGAVDVCANVSIASAAINSLFTISGTFASAGIVTASGVVAGANSMGAAPIILPPGALSMVTSALTETGQVKWTLHYVPLETSAAVA